jgi:peroxiredoxin
MNMTMFDQEAMAIGSSFPNLKLESTKGSFHLSDYQGQQNAVVHFVCHFSCSRCWRSMMSLGQLYPSFQGLNTAVLAIGTNKQLHPASQLAQELHIPFPLLTTATDACPVSHFSAAVLLDANGIVHHGQFTHSPTAILDVNALLPAAARLRAQQKRIDAQRRTGFRPPATTPSKAPKRANFIAPCLNPFGYSRPDTRDGR